MSTTRDLTRFQLLEIDIDPIHTCAPESLADLLTRRDRERSAGPWVPACNGTEVPFLTRSGRRLLYCWQPSTGRHAYLDCETDLILSDADAAACIGLA